MTRNCNSEKHVYTCPIHWGLSHGPLQTGVCTGAGPWEGFEVSFEIWDVGKDWVAVWQGMTGKDFEKLCLCLLMLHLCSTSVI